MDDYLGNAQSKFQLTDWVNRGLCIRKYTGGGDKRNTEDCYLRLQNVLTTKLNGIRTAEYAGAAGVLALLPTIGALLGAPTNEIWRLLMMIPFGGLIATACSFGGAILPVKVKDYESDFMKRNINGKLRSSDSTLALPEDIEEDMIKQRADILLARIEGKLQSELREKVPVIYILVGITGMLILLGSAQVAMIVVELGAVLPWWCQSKWWVHLWYFMVIVSASIDNYVQLPFEKQWRLCLSDVPYDLTVMGGDLINKHVTGEDHKTNSVRIALGQLKTLKTGTLRFVGYPQRSAEPRNVLFVLVSVTSHTHGWRKTFIRSLSKIVSIAVFIVGTTCFASAQLLSVAMATFVLTCVLGAGVFGRAITSWIVTGIEKAEPMLHYVADTQKEAHYVLARLFEIGPTRTSRPHMRQIQVELHGQVFLNQRRVAARSLWPPRFLGILTRPFNLANAVYKRKDDDGGFDLENFEDPGNNVADSQPLMRPAPTLMSTLGTDVSESNSSIGATAKQNRNT